MRKNKGVGATLVAGTMALTAAAVLSFAQTSSASPSPGSTHFPRYKELESNVAFWGQVFSKWTSRQIAFHDVEHLDLVYSVLSVDDIVERLPAAQQEDAIRARRKAEGERISAMLKQISDGHARTEEERRILKAIAKIGHDASYAETLSNQVRSQRGLGDRFCEAMARYEAYRPAMSRILAAYDVPQELLAIPIVESGYKIGAKSHAGATGIWQFMPATGRLYMEVGAAYDDRRDPLRATEGAARMLRKSYENLGSWPLAITGYNHGPGGIARAVKEMGTTHFGVISRHYKGKAFGFASRNYYAEFLAAVDAMRRSEELCGPIQVEIYQPDEVTLGASASIRDLARAAGTSVENLDNLNPALSQACSSGAMKVPRGYRLNLPRGTRDEFASRFVHVDRSAPALPTVVAKAGPLKLDKASTTASTVTPLNAGNAGSIAVAPGKAAATTPTVTPVIAKVEPREREHKVGKGETLGQIARRYGTTETTLLYMNRLRSASSLKAGQTLRVPADRPASDPVAIAKATVPRPVFSTKQTTNAGISAAKEAGQVAAAAALAAQTAGAVMPAAVIEKDEPAVREGDAEAEEAAAKEAAGEAEAESAPAAKEAEPAVVDKPGDKKAPAAKEEVEEEAPILTAEHKVGRGQTLTQIASMYHTSVDELKRMNDIEDASSVQAGQTLKVRASASELVSQTTVGRTYKVRSGDTLWTVAKANDTSVETLKRLNPKVAASGLRSGDTIKVPSSGSVAVASKSSVKDGTASTKESSKKVASKSPSKSTKTAKAAPKPSYRSHKVTKGQTLSSIAQKYRTNVDTLKRINGIRDAKSVQVGKTLKVPL